jgi:hypothetical protein
MGYYLSTRLARKGSLAMLGRKDYTKGILRTGNVVKYVPDKTIVGLALDATGSHGERRWR